MQQHSTHTTKISLTTVTALNELYRILKDLYSSRNIAHRYRGRLQNSMPSFYDGADESERRLTTGDAFRPNAGMQGIASQSSGNIKEIGSRGTLQREVLSPTA